MAAWKSNAHANFANDIRRVADKGRFAQARGMLASTDWRTAQEAQTETDELWGFCLTRLRKELEVGRELGVYAP